MTDERVFSRTSLRPRKVNKSPPVRVKAFKKISDKSITQSHGGAYKNFSSDYLREGHIKTRVLKTLQKYSSKSKSSTFFKQMKQMGYSSPESKVMMRKFQSDPSGLDISVPFEDKSYEDWHFFNLVFEFLLLFPFSLSARLIALSDLLYAKLCINLATATTT